METDYENLKDYFPFESMRLGQPETLEAIQKYLEDPNIRYILIEAATGSGKSPQALAAAGASNSAYVATANKFLQDQYIRDFSEIMVDLKGRANYRCLCHDVPPELKHKYGSFYNCGNAPCRETKESRAECAKNKACEYHKQLFKAAKANIVCFNFASALAFLNHMPQYFKERNLLVCDECHNIPSWVTNFVGVEITLRTLSDLELKEEIPDFPEVEDYGLFICSVQREISCLLDSEEQIDSKLIHKLENFQNKLDLFDTITDSKKNMRNFVMEKIYEKTHGGYSQKLIKILFKPVVISDIVEKYLFRFADKVLLLSATILDFPTYMDIMGLDPEQTAIIRVPSTFPPENRPIFTHMSVGYLSKDNLNASLPDIVKAIKTIIDYYPDYKGIIHGVTYKICDYIHDNLDTDRLLYPRKAEEQKDIFKVHLESKKATILLSPSMTEGVDLKYDSSRFQIQVKTPYAYLGDPVLKARIAIYHNYYNMLTALALTQAYGRSIRAEDDFCYTFFLDSSSLNFIQNNLNIVQNSLIQALQ